MQPMCFTDTDHLRREVSRIGRSHFFDRATMRFFDSRVLADVYGCRYFVTSERFRSLDNPADDGERRYTVREITKDGRIVDVSAFQEFRTARAAKRHAMTLAATSPWPHCGECGSRVHPDFRDMLGVCQNCRERQRELAARQLRQAPYANDRAFNGEWRGSLSGATITIAADPTDWTRRIVTWGDGCHDTVRNADVSRMISSGILERIPGNARNHAENDETAGNDPQYQNAP